MEVSKTYFPALSPIQVLEPFSNKTPSNATQLEVLPDALWVEETSVSQVSHPISLGDTLVVNPVMLSLASKIDRHRPCQKA